MSDWRPPTDFLRHVLAIEPDQFKAKPQMERALRRGLIPARAQRLMKAYPPISDAAVRQLLGDLPPDGWLSTGRQQHPWQKNILNGSATVAGRLTQFTVEGVEVYWPAVLKIWPGRPTTAAWW